VTAEADDAVAQARRGKPGTMGSKPPTFTLTPVSAAPAPEEEEQALYEIRKRIHPRAVHGWFAGWRVALVVATQLVFYGLPWLTWNGREAVLFDLGARKFYVFGLVFWPQDFVYLAALLIVSALSLFLFTAVAGRLWCGYACPQTVYTEIFMWIERKIEGDRVARIRLDAAPWSAGKLARKGVKHSAWIALALWTGFTFVGYFTPIRTLGAQALALALGPWEAFWILFYALATYGNAGWLREQVCKYMCPYARFQGVMFDPDTLVISYDPHRGEPRGARSRKVDHRAAGLGDCVDCSICVQVCPVGIDIRNGLQYECIGCAACIDGCDQVMEKMGYRKGLIRYTTQNALSGRHPEPPGALRKVSARIARPRVVVYAAVLAGVVTLVLVSLYLRVPLKVNVLRDRASLVREAGGGRIENVYQLQIINTVERPRRFAVAASGLPRLDVVLDGAQPIDVQAASSRLVPVRVQVDPTGLAPGSHRIAFRVEAVDDASVAADEKSVFFVR
jgi:cytochrome c oxidase accessory protein FixG